MSSVRLEIAERQLANGLTLLAVRNPGVATFAACVVLDIDVRDEAPHEHGLVNLVGDCIDEGTERYSATQLAEQLERIGASLEGQGDGGGVMSPAESASQAVRLLEEVVFHPRFPAREVRRVQQEIVAEIKSERDDPRAVASRRFMQRIYGKHPYGRPARGTERTVAAFGPSALRTFHRRMFVPSRGYVAAAGPDQPERMLDMLAKVFRGATGQRAERGATKPPVLARERHDEHIELAREQVHVYLGHLGIRRADPDYYALSVMDHILGTGPGFTSRIARRLRDEEGLCYAVDAGITRSAREEPGCFAAYIGTSPEHRERAIDGFLAEMRRIRTELPSPTELADVQEYLTGSFVWQLERNAALARYLIRAKRFDLGFDYLERYPELIRGVTRADVRRVATERLHPDSVTIVSAGASGSGQKGRST